MELKARSISAMLRWWADGLRQALPGPLSNLIFGPDSVLSLLIRDDRAILTFETMNRVLPLTEVDVGTDPKSGVRKAGRSRAVRKAIALEVGQAVIRLPRSKVLSTHIDLPARSALDLHGAVRANLDRFTPFSTEDVYFDAQIIAVDNETDRIKVALQVAQVSDVEAAMDVARSIGLRPTRVTDERNGDRPTMNLLPASRRHRPRRFLQKTVKTLFVILVGAIAVHAGLLYAQKREALSASRDAIRQLRTTAVAAAEMEDRLIGFQAAVARIEEIKSEHPDPLVAIAAVTEALPDRSFLIGLELEDGTLTLSGFSQDPTGMLLRLEENARLRNARFAAPTTRDARTGLNRFIVEVEMNGETG